MRVCSEQGVRTLFLEEGGEKAEGESSTHGAVETSPVILHCEVRRCGLHAEENACGVVWCGVVWCGVVWCGVVWCGVVWRGVVCCGVVWCGVVWCGVAWCGVVWRGVAWCGLV